MLSPAEADVLQGLQHGIGCLINTLHLCAHGLTDHFVGGPVVQAVVIICSVFAVHDRRNLAQWDAYAPCQVLPDAAVVGRSADNSG